MKIIDYNRKYAYDYAKNWAYKRNPSFYDFSNLGGDCTNFASQCLFAGAQEMNFTPVIGWFYNTLNDRSASWTGVEFFYRFLLNNTNGIGNKLGPFAKEIPLSQIQIGDFIQLGRATGDFYHTPIVVGFKNNIPLVAAHSSDTFNRPLTDYPYERIRCLHILGFRSN